MMFRNPLRVFATLTVFSMLVLTSNQSSQAAELPAVIVADEGAEDRYETIWEVIFDFLLMEREDLAAALLELIDGTAADGSSAAQKVAPALQKVAPALQKVRSRTQKVAPALQKVAPILQKVRSRTQKVRPAGI